MDVKKLANIPPLHWPEGVDEMVLGVLVDQSAKDADRLIAAELGGNYAMLNDRLADGLLSILEKADETEQLRGRAAIAFGPALENADTHGFEDPDDLLVSEDMFHRIGRSLQRLYMDGDVPKYVRRRILEASVRAPQDWHRGAIRVAYHSDDKDWKLTAVFCMVFVRGLDDEILEALDSKNPLIHRHAVQAAGNWEIDAAWPHISALVKSGRTEKELLFAAIEAVADLRPSQARGILAELADSRDEEIQEAVIDALTLAGVGEYDDEYDDEDDEDDDKLF